MSKSQPFQAFQYALLIHDRTGEVMGGTGSQHDLDGTRRLAESILKITPQAATVWVHPYMGDKYVPSCVEVVRRSEITIPEGPQAPEFVLSEEIPVEMSLEVVTPDVPVEQSPEPLPMKRKRGRPPVVKQEA